MTLCDWDLHLDHNIVEVHIVVIFAAEEVEFAVGIVALVAIGLHPGEEGDHGLSHIVEAAVVNDARHLW